MDQTYRDAMFALAAPGAKRFDKTGLAPKSQTCEPVPTSASTRCMNINFQSAEVAEVVPEPRNRRLRHKCRANLQFRFLSYPRSRILDPPAQLPKPTTAVPPWASHKGTNSIPKPPKPVRFVRKSAATRILPKPANQKLKRELQRPDQGPKQHRPRYGIYALWYSLVPARP